MKEIGDTLSCSILRGAVMHLCLVAVSSTERLEFCSHSFHRVVVIVPRREVLIIYRKTLTWLTNRKRELYSVIYAQISSLYVILGKAMDALIS